MHSSFLAEFDYNAYLKRALEFFLHVVDYIKGLLVYKFYEVPYLGKTLAALPLWVYGILVLVVVCVTPYIAYLVLSGLKGRLLSMIMGGKLGEVMERRRIVAQAKRFAANKEYVRAADMFLIIKENAKAARVLEEGEEYSKAGKIYEKMGKLDTAADMFQKAGDFTQLADLLKKKGDHRKAAETFMRLGKKLMAAEAYDRAGEYVKAAELYAESGSLQSAATCYENAKDFKKAAEMYDRGYVEGTASKEIPSPEVAAKMKEMSLMAAKYFEQTGNYAKAADSYARVKELGKAGEVSLKSGDRARAAEYFRVARQYERAAEIVREGGDARRACEIMAEKYMAEGNDAEAGRMYLEAGDHVKAADLFESSGNYTMAADAYMVSADYSTAALMYIEGGDMQKAAEAYSRAGESGKAAQLYIQTGDIEKASALVESSGDYMLAAELNRKLNRPDKELAALQRVDPEDPRYHSAVIRLAEMFKAQGNPKLAAEYYAKAIGGSPADHGNLELYYGLANACEAAGQYGDASDVYGKVLLVDFQFKDSDARKKECDRLVAAGARPKAPGPAPRPAPPAGASAAGASAAGGASDPAKRYAIVKEVGRGGMGVVYEAKDNNLNRVIALKLLPKSFSENPQVLKRFAQEARSAAQLNHPNIVTLYDFQQAGGRSFITMEMVEGVTLKKLMASAAKMPLVNKLKIIYQCCQGLHYAHEAGIIHRDIKPSNIMINKQSVVKIMDFGLAKAGGEETLTDAGMISGTVMYMSPEQLVGDKLDRRSDIYALGLVFYELVALRHPFAEGDAAYQHVHTPPKPPKTLNPAIPDRLDQIIMKCLEKDRNNRFGTAAELAMSLREVPLK
ncbi:MAG: protein kinase [Nitrospirae bacterium]|nr:protein kinase [Nitrospirota bacterium]